VLVWEKCAHNKRLRSKNVCPYSTRTKFFVLHTVLVLILTRTLHIQYLRYTYIQYTYSTRTHIKFFVLIKVFVLHTVLHSKFSYAYPMCTLYSYNNS